MKCPICGKDLELMTPSHAKKHNMTVREMELKYPGVVKGHRQGFRHETNAYIKTWISRK
jgi:hypothetical protein